MDMRFPTIAFLSILLLGCATNQKETRGSLALKVRGGQMKTQATVSEISTVSVKVQASDNAIQSHDFSAADLVSNSASVQFNSLHVGLASISIQVLASGSLQIGSATSSAMILSDQTTPLSLTVGLAPTYVDSGDLGIGLSIEQGDEKLGPQYED